MTSDLQRVLNTLESGEVRRYHASPDIEPQTDAAHQWGVVIILLYLLGPSAPDETVAVLTVEGAMHDTGELVAGDSPHFLKHANPDLADKLAEIERAARMEFMLLRRPGLNENDVALLKYADCLEALSWCVKHSLPSPFPGVHGLSLAGRFREQYACLHDKHGNALQPSQRMRANHLYQLLIDGFGS